METVLGIVVDSPLGLVLKIIIANVCLVVYCRILLPLIININLVCWEFNKKLKAINDESSRHECEYKCKASKPLELAKASTDD